MTTYSTVSNAFFNDFHSLEEGGVFVLNKFTIDFHCCFFVNCTSDVSGGVLSSNESNLTIRSFSCTKCSVTVHENEKYGNSIKALRCTIFASSVETYLCGISEAISGDSSFMSWSSSTKIDQMNATYNYGYRGASGPSLLYNDDKSYVKYANIVEPRDHRCVETGSNLLKINFTNFLFCTKISDYVLYSESDDAYEIRSSIFWDIGNKQISHYKIITIDCKTNSEIESIEKISEFTAQLIEIKFRCYISYPVINYHIFKFYSNWKAFLFLSILI